VKCAIYVRLAVPGEDLSAQIAQLREFARSRGLDSLVYEDFGTGTKTRRPGLDDLIADARRGRFSVVMIMSLDRLARSTKHLLQVVAEFHTLQIDLISLKEKVDTTTSVGKEFYTVLADLMQCQAALVREHIRRGMRRAKLDGVRLGRAPLNVDHEALVADRLGGMSLTAAATKWRISRASVVRLVREAQRKQTGLPVVVSLQPETAYVV